MSKPNRPTARRSSLAGSSPIQPPAAEPQRPAPAEVEPQRPAPAEVEPTVTTPAAKPTAAKPRTTTKGNNLTDTVRVGIYLSTDDATAARGAYLADWQAGGQADTFSRWISDAITTHADRTAAERTDLARPVVRSEERTGESRSFNVAVDAIERMRAAIAEDHAAGRWPTDSAWCGDAVAAAVAHARARSGGTLPTPPARLPNRLRR